MEWGDTMNAFRDNLGKRPQARAEGLVAERVGQELVIYDETSQTAHSLAPDAALVWGKCDGRMSEAEIASKLALPAQVVEQAVGEFRDSGLLIDGGGITRRQAGKRFAAVGGAALAAPLLYSVAVPGAALAALTCKGGPATISDADYQTPTCDATFVLFVAELTAISGAPAAGWTISLAGGAVSTPMASGAICGCACGGGTGIVNLPDSTVIGSPSAPAAGTMCVDSASNGPVHVTVPVNAGAGGQAVFLTAFAVPASCVGFCIKQSGPDVWSFPLSGPNGMTVTVRVATWAFNSPAAPLAIGPICPSTSQSAADFNFNITGNQSQVIQPQNPALVETHGGSQGSGGNTGPCAFLY